MHVGIANSRWWGKRSRHSRRMRNPQFCVSGKRPMISPCGHHYNDITWTTLKSEIKFDSLFHTLFRLTAKNPPNSESVIDARRQIHEQPRNQRVDDRPLDLSRTYIVYNCNATCKSCNTGHVTLKSKSFEHDVRWWAGARPTNDISIEFGIRPKFAVL